MASPTRACRTYTFDSCATGGTAVGSAVTLTPGAGNTATGYQAILNNTNGNGKAREAVGVGSGSDGGSE